jgi:nitronate monooxygenase
MAGGVTTPELVAAVCNAGGLGSIGAGYLPPEKIKETIQRTKQLTSHPFAVNLFVPKSFEILQAQVHRMNQFLKKYRNELRLSDWISPSQYEENFQEQIRVILDEQPAVFSFTFGIPSPEILMECKKKEILTLGTATHLAEAQALEAAGVDAICAQGVEAGGHQGTFIQSTPTEYLSTRTLVSQITNSIKLPVIAAGGIMNGQNIGDYLNWGVQGVQMGTAFLLCPEAGTSQAYRQALLDAKSSSLAKTAFTFAFTGRKARALQNQFMIEVQKEFENHADLIPPYPIQHCLTREIRQKAAQIDCQEYLSLWAGEGFRLVRSLPAKDLMAQLVAELNPS